ncbi:MAG: SDR family NAD(P)-dependent oxidoreductase [Chitinophagaceae bacterium]|nr:SDR family NAD(P)-dependent oxidoreductase [Chitinophagaceae bacterium]
MATIIITGGTGLIGTAVAEKLLEKGYKVIILSRKKHAGAKNNLSYAEWDVEKGTIDENAIRSADAIIHLAGAGVADKRWTKNRKRKSATAA